MATLTCLSCEHYRPSGCAELGPGAVGYPAVPLARCAWASYAPGSDEAEDHDSFVSGVAHV